MEGGSELARELAARFDLSTNLSADELVELTERALERGREEAAPDRLVSLESCLQVLETSEVPKQAIVEAIAAVLENRERRLSNVIAAKAHEMERSLLALLPRLDTSYHSCVEQALSPEGAPKPGAEPGKVRFQLRSERGHLHVRVRHVPVTEEAMTSSASTSGERGSRRDSNVGSGGVGLVRPRCA